MGKKCVITNQPLTWVMEVDDIKVAFSGSDKADYFEAHYKSLGYEVVRTN
jgi:hypothetical protein